MWDMSGNRSLRALVLEDFTRLHDLMGDNMLVIKQYKKWVSIIVIFVVLAFVRRTIIPNNIFLKLDFSQEYRNIKGIDDVVFRKNDPDKYYARCFWGLKKIEPPDKFTEWDGKVGVLPEIDKFIKYVDEHDIWVNQAVVSPDGKYILYSEIIFGYRGTGITDDEFCCYRVFEIDPGQIQQAKRSVDRYHPWYRYYDVGIEPELFEVLGSEAAIGSVVEKVEQVLIVFFSADKATEQIIRASVKEAVELGSDMLMRFKEKKSAKCTAILYLHQLDNVK